MPRLESGARLNGYQIVRLLGAGGMGEVWLATEQQLGRKVALKLLPAELTQDPARVRRFEQEARTASALSHPNVCTIHALGSTADGQHYIAMEYVEGRTLRARLAAGRLTIGEVLEISAQIASALTAAHAAGIVHRDIKPDNVLLRPDGLVKVLDFGLAKLTAGPDSDGSDVTHTAFRTEEGAVLGTAPYMSPEQAKGHAVDARTDIWSLGVVLYEMVTGRLPFEASSTTEVLAAILDRDPPPISQFEPKAPTEMQRIVRKALRKDGDQRYQTARDLLLDLQALSNDLRTEPASGSGVDRAGAESIASPTNDQFPLAGRSRRARLIVRAAIVLLAGLALSVWWTVGQPPSAPSASGAPVPRHLSALTFGPGLQSDPTWSPDGQSVAYASDRAGNLDIWLQPVGGGDPIQLTKSPASDTQPAWSPKGDAIVFRSERDGGGLFIVPARSGPERQLTSFGVFPQWSADGSEILFRPTRFSIGLFVVSAGGGAPAREILGDFLKQGAWYWTASHPDGRISALGVHPRFKQGFFTVTRDGRHITPSEVAPGLPLLLGRSQRSGQGTRVERFLWHPTGTMLYVEAIVNEVRNIWRVKVDPRTLQWQAAEQMTVGGGADVGAALDPGGRRLVFTTERYVSRLWTYSLDATGRRIIGEGTALTPTDQRVGFSDLSPDGRRVAYAMTRPGSSRVDLWTLDIESGDRELFARGVVTAAWSPDGEALAYNLFRDEPAPGQWALAVRRMSGAERLLSPWSDEWGFLPTDWTRDGAAIVGPYFKPINAPAALALWDSSTPSSMPVRVLLAQADASLWQARFSPNGRWLTFVLGRHVNATGVDLMVAPGGGAPPGQWSRIAAEHVWPDKPRWSSDGRTLYFLSRHHTGRLDLWGVAFDPVHGRPVGSPFVITQFDKPDHMISSDIASIEMGVGGRRVLLTMASVTGNIWILDNVDR